MAQDKKKKEVNIEVAIKKAVEAGLQAGRLQTEKCATEAYRATERRLYAYPVLLKKVEDDRERLAELLNGSVRERSKSIVRFSRYGSRLSDDEKLEALIVDVQATIAADEHEIETMYKALETIAHDPYYETVTGKYLDGKHDDEIAEGLPCDASTVRRNRGRLMRKLAIRLYGARAI